LLLLFALSPPPLLLLAPFTRASVVFPIFFLVLVNDEAFANL
jgi:hypothetical protein